MTNCTKEYSLAIVNMYWEREWERIKKIDFPATREYTISNKECISEIIGLRDEIRNNKASSKTIIKFHESRKYANKQKRLSPYDYWQYIKTDKDEFKKFYENRLRCSDWYKEKDGANLKYLAEGFVPEFIYGIGLTTSGKAPLVSYFKPALAKNIILKYLHEYKTIFDPCSGYSGRLIGALCAGKDYIGYDINDLTIAESYDIFQFIRNMIKGNAELNIGDSLKREGEYECLFTCPPYGNIEEWQTSNGKVTSELTCDDWIDSLTARYKCKKYLFVVDDSIIKYKDRIVYTLENSSHFGKNKEYIVMIGE